LGNSQSQENQRPNLPPIDTALETGRGSATTASHSGVSTTSQGPASMEVQRIESIDSTGGYFSGGELSPSPINVGPPAIEPTNERQSYETDELEGLAEDRVVAQGYLLSLKNVSGVRQWKRRWVVLRGRSLTLYKNFDVHLQSTKLIVGI
jgi:hypothetical protein